MVDYNLQVPGIAPAQNAMQINPMQIIPLMQQQQLNNMLMQERARELQETNSLRGLMTQPGFNPYSPQGRQAMITTAPTKVGPAVSKAFADIGLTQRQEQEASVRIAAAVQKMGIEKFDALGGRLAAVDPADPATYNAWFKEAAPNMPGVKLPTPQEWERATPEQRLAAQRRLLTDGATIRTQILKDAEEANKPVSGNWVTTSTGERVFEPSAVRPGQIPAITPGVRAPVGAPMGAQPPLPPQRGGAAGYVVPGVGQVSLNALSPPSTDTQAGMVLQTPAAQTALGQAPRVAPSATGEKYDARVEPLGGFKPAGGQTPAQAKEEEAAATARGQATVKRAEALPKATTALRATTSEIDKEIANIDRLMTSPGFTRIFGLMNSMTKDVSPEARAAADLLSRIGGESVISSLTNLRASSPTGATGFGSLTEKEGERLERIGVPSRAVAPEDAKKVLADRKAVLLDMKRRAQESYRMEFPDADQMLKQRGAAPPAAGGNVVNWADLP